MLCVYLLWLNSLMMLTLTGQAMISFTYFYQDDLPCDSLHFRITKMIFSIIFVWSIFLIQHNFQIIYDITELNRCIDMVVAARALAELRLVSVFARMPEFWAAMHIKTLLGNALYLSSLGSNLSMWGHFLTVLNLRNPNLRPAHKNFVWQCTLRHL